MKNIRNHSQYSESDYSYLRNKGYTNKEIITMWNRELTRHPVEHIAPFDIVGYINQ